MTAKIKIKRKNRASTASLITALMLLLCLAVIGCKKETASTPISGDTSKKAKSKPKQKDEQTGKATNITTREQSDLLDFSNRKDPFKPFISVQSSDRAGAKKQATVTGDKLPIHSFEVVQFRLIGTVLDPRGNRAMVIDPAGKGYVLKPGMTIGKNEGKISRITANGVDVVELSRDENNRVRKETIVIPLLRKP